VILTRLQDCINSGVENVYFPPFLRLLYALKCVLYVEIEEPWDFKADKKVLDWIAQVLVAQKQGPKGILRPEEEKKPKCLHQHTGK